MARLQYYGDLEVGLLRMGIITQPKKTAKNTPIKSDSK
jgi:hypothetical protein